VRPNLLLIAALLTSPLACAPASPDPTDAPATDSCDEVPTGWAELPRDEGPHGEAIEWWYWTGHLQADDGRWFGFQETFFLFGIGEAYAQLGQAAITDIQDGSFHYVSDFAFDEPNWTDGSFDLARDGMYAQGGGGVDEIRAVVGTCT